MALNADDKTNVQSVWTCVSGHTEQFGADALYRMFHCYPATKVYFPNFDFTINSPKIKAQGKKIMDALTECVKHMDSLEKTMSHLSDLHAYNLRVDPVNFKILAQNILVVIATHKKLGCALHTSLDKFLCCVSAELTRKYR
ncbi:hemoglobin subunit alpha-C-like [Gastrophryne carolinensis]